ncbi:MAG: efflux RND transporter periplasmic adaptor subunit [Pirellulales bacterium]
MSTEQPVDPHLVEQTKQQIRSLVVEIAQLAKQDLSARDFYGEFLSRVVSALAAMGGAVWAPGESGGLELQYQINLRDTRLPESQENLVRHGMLVHKTLTSGEGALVAPHSGEGENGQAGNPTDFLLILGPVKVDQDTRGVVEIFQRPGAPTTTQRGYLKFLLQMCDLASDYLKNRQLRHFTDRQTLWNQLENFSRMAHISLNPREAAYTIANEGRRLIECDRVSVAIRRGRKCTIEAISGQDTFDRRSNTVSLLNRLATAVVASGEPLWYSGDSSDLAPQVEEAVQEYVDDSHSKNVAVLPLRRPSDPSDEKAEHEPIGALIVEQIEDARPREGMVQRVNVVCDHSSLALANALEHNGLFLLPLWRALGKATWVLRARTLPKTISVVLVVAALITAMAVVPVNFTLLGDGELQPVTRRDVFSATEGTIVKVHVRTNDVVQSGQLLAEMDNPELDVAIARAHGELLAAQRKYSGIAEALHNQDRGKEPGERERLTGEQIQVEEEIRSLERQLDIHRTREQQLRVISPIDGQITTPDLERELLTRTVPPGKRLMSVADPKGAWQLEIHMDESRMGHITRAQHEFGKDLRVTYHLATDPAANHEGRVTEVHWSAELRGDKGNTVTIKVAIDKSELEDLLRPGATVKARVYCGKRSFGYRWLHDAIDFVRSRVLFPMNL